MTCAQVKQLAPTTMAHPVSRLLLVLALLLQAGGLQAQRLAADSSQQHPCGDDVAARRQAYVTLLYGEEFVLGARVLGRSLHRSGTCRDRVLMVAGELSPPSQATLTADGWILQPVPTIHNPGTWTRGDGRAFPQRFWAVYSKLALFNLTQYETVVFLDADTLVVRNVDEMFSCPGFCAALRHSERFNSGVMVVRPSPGLMEDMLDKILDLPSYTGGEQGFLNEYFKTFADSPLFDPSKGPDAYPEGMKYARLPTAYNADLGLYLINCGKWSIAPESLAVVHYTLGAAKPWDWWAAWLVDEDRRWQGYRSDLPADASGQLHGESAGQLLTRWLLLPLPLILMQALLWCGLCRVAGGADRTCWLPLTRLDTTTSCHSEQALLLPSKPPVAYACAEPSAPDSSVLQHHKHHLHYQHLQQPQQQPQQEVPGYVLSASQALPASQAAPLGACTAPKSLAAQAVAAGFGSVVMGLMFVAKVVPRQARPQYAWFMALEWLLLIFCLVFSAFLHHCYRLGCRARVAAAAAGPSRHPMVGTVVGMCGACAALLLLPMWGLWLAQGLVHRVLVTSLALGVTCVLVSHVAVQLAGLWWQWGAAQRGGYGGAGPQHACQRHKGW